MHVVALAWIYVVLMMAVVEAMSPDGTLLGAILTFVLLRRAAAVHRALHHRAADPDGGGRRPGDAVAAIREEVSQRSSTVHQSPPLMCRTPARCRRSRASCGRLASQRGAPSAACAGDEAQRVGLRRRLAEGLQHVGADLELPRPDARPQPDDHVLRRAAGGRRTAPTASPRPRRRPGRASRHAPQPPRGRRARPAAPAGSRRPARRRPRPARRSRRHRPAAARPQPAPLLARTTRLPCTCRSHSGCAPMRRDEAAAVLGHRGRVVADGDAQVQAVPGRGADAAGARAHQRADPRRSAATAAAAGRRRGLRRHPGRLRAASSRRRPAACRPRTRASSAAHGRSGT